MPLGKQGLTLKVLELLREAVDDTDAYIVGGAVRDGFLGRMPEDIDVS
ncbi:MAG: polynucleotide adenylyltransferase PcnB, partial [Synergistetes bacterium]|nr:polynucleotide adenylyltransferase PcnB [Synergistota bacterium]